MRKKENAPKVFIIRLTADLLTDALLTALFVLAAKMIFDNAALGGRIMTFFLAPICMFASAFVSLSLSKGFIPTVLSNAVQAAVLFFLENELSWMFLLWLVIYMVSAFIGYVIATAARSYKIPADKK